MDARIITEASIDLPLLGRKLNEVGIALDAEIAEPLRSAIAAFVIAISPKFFSGIIFVRAWTQEPIQMEY
jgi:hypothetical protein